MIALIFLANSKSCNACTMFCVFTELYNICKDTAKTGKSLNGISNHIDKEEAT